MTTLLAPASRTHSSDPIGVFDSGVGGLSVLAELVKLLPNEHFVYYADTANVPYGGKTDDQIRDLTADAVNWLHQYGCKAVVVACNTASAFSLQYLRAHFGLQFPIIGLVPAVKPAAIACKTGCIGVLATPGTLRGQLLNQVISLEATPRHIKVLMAVSLKLVPFVEQGLQNSAACKAELQHILQPLIDQHIDHLVLGCTHYPFLAPTIKALYPHLPLVDSGAAVAKQTLRQLQQNHLLYPQNNVDSSPLQTIQFYTSKYTTQLKQVVNGLYPYPIQWLNVEKHYAVSSN